MKPLLLAIVLSCQAFGFAEAAEIPTNRAVHTLVAAADSPDMPYLAFPAVLDLGDEVLVSFKRGRAHGLDQGAVLDLVRLDRVTGAVRSRGPLALMEGEIMQMGEWVRFANGDIANYIDAQGKQAPLRSGLCVVRSSDGGRTFGPVQRVGPVDGVEYGYAFDAITRDGTTRMLAMTFANLPGGKLVYATRSQPGSVDVIRSDDNGRTWHFVRSLTAALDGAPINESAFMTHGPGFIVTARGYDNRQWLLRTDEDFKPTARIDLTAAHEAITSHIGRPRLFMRDGGCYLLGRNWAAKGLMQLALFKFNPETLAIRQHVILDNAERKSVADGYYAQPYWQMRDGRLRFNVITYKRSAEKAPDIIRLEFDWEEVR